MNEIEKLYENAGFIQKRCKDYSCIVCDKQRDCDKYPPFTAKKQIELIKWLAYKTIKIVRFDNCFYVGTKFKPCKEDGGCFAGCEEIEFTDALAGLTNHLWQDLTEEERKQIKEILK